MMILIWHLDSVFWLSGQKANILASATAYLHAIVWGLPAALGLFVFKEIMTALARPRLVIILTGLSIPLNIVLNYGLMYGQWGLPKLGLAGIGWASTCVFWIIFAGAVLLLKYHPRLQRLRLLQLRPVQEPKHEIKQRLRHRKTPRNSVEVARGLLQQKGGEAKR